ncbi:putative crocetin glucosyltransferase [Helianthus annuus]|nr:putative crocetin glucosyltransferase [Helianthus annuus]
MTNHMKTKILVVAYPTQGHINPSLRFANRLVKLNVDVTYSTSVSVIRHIDIQTTHHGITFAPFSDGYDNGLQPTTTGQQFYSDFSTKGVSAIAEIIKSAAAAGQPFDHLVYTSAIPWAAKVANAHNLESTLLWSQAAIVLDIYYYYFNGYQDLISCNNNPMFSINLPRLPSLTIADLPSFMLPSCLKEHKFILESMKDHLDVLKISSRLLVNTFDELEVEAIKSIEKLVVFPVGPLVPSEFLDGNGQSYNSFGCDLFEKPVEDYIKWLNAKPKSSVVYVSFGSLATLAIDQVEEIASGLVESGRPFLWVIRDSDQVGKLSKIEELKKQGMIVSWCSQVEVLTNQAIGCFVMHGGWNSTVEALAAGVPTIVFSQWSDQATNAKMIEDFWKIGVKVKKREGDGMVEGKEIKRCVEIVMEDGEMSRNAEKWKELARQALGNSGSLALNLQAFVHDVRNKTTIYKNSHDEHVEKG